MKSKIKIAHIINPVSVPETSDLFVAQPITFESMRFAQLEAEKAGLEVELWACCYEEDRDRIPSYLQTTPYLTQSLLDFGEFKKKKKLPLIGDIIHSLGQNSDADYFIYTNVDIAVKPDFYNEVLKKINRGYDSFVINRRTIPGHYTSTSQLNEMYQEFGEKHPGYDCFVFKKEYVKNFCFNKTVIGSIWIGAVMISNLVMTAKKFKIFKEELLTFHIGNDRVWIKSDFDDIAAFNKVQYDKTINDLRLKSGKFLSSLRHFIGYKYPVFFKLLPGRIK